MSQLAEQTHLIVQEMVPDLPALVGPEAWPALAAELARLDAEWAATDDARRVGIGARYRTALAPYPAARERLAVALRSATLHNDVLAATAALLEELGDADGAAALREATARRYITGLKVGQEAQSFKLANVRLTFWSASAAIGAVLSAVAAVAAPDVQPVAIAGTVLLLISSLAQPLVRKIDAGDASVFLGLALAAGEAREATLTDIVAATNAARNDGPLRLGVLTEEQVHRSLSVLWKTYKSVEPVDREGKRWRVVEEHGQLEP